MKKNDLLKSVIVAFLIFFPILSIYAVRAYRGPVKITQPDGTSLTIKVHGDEFRHYTTTEDNYLIQQNSKGIYAYAEIDAQGNITAGVQAARDASIRPVSDSKFLKKMPEKLNTVSSLQMSRARSSRQNVTAPRKTYPLNGSPKALVILVNFSDKTFVTPAPQTAFQNLLTQSGYSTNGGTGSAKDYFMASSYGKFAPDFVAVGPFNLPNNLAFYGANDVDGYDKKPAEMILDACAAADATVDFTQYDTDNDGYVDNVFVYYAGYNEAEGGAANTIWPHRWNISSAGITSGITFDGKKIEDYSCTSELKNSSGSSMCGVGTFCHEFGHVLGLPDYYDTSGSSTYITTLDTWSVMDYGPYLNGGNTPPAYSAYDRFYLGFLTPQEVSTRSNLTLLPLYQGTTAPSNTNNQSFLFSASTHNLNGLAPNPAEFFMVEYRKHTGWDTWLGQLVDADGNLTTVPSDGMLIWHIDYDENAWYNNGPNNYTGSTQTLASHMRVYLQPLSGSATTPGEAFISGNFTPTTWSGTNINRALTEITKTTDNIKFKLMGGTNTTVNIGVVEGELKFPNTSAGKSNPKNLNIKTTSITGNLTVTLSGTNSDYYSVGAATITQAAANSASGFDLLVTYKPLTAGIHSAVLTISGGGLPDKVINLSGTAN